MFEETLNRPKAKLDWQMLVALFGLMVLGTAFIHSAKPGDESTAWYNLLAVRQVVWYILGAGAVAVVLLIDYRVLARWSIVGYWACVFALVAVLIPGIGQTHGWGARRWIDIGPFGLQPSEFAKIGFILLMAHHLSRPREELRSPGVFAQAMGLALLPFGLILREPDLGSALVFLPVALAMMFVAGVPARYLGRTLAGLALAVALLLVDVLFAPPNWQVVKLEDYQRRRLLVYFGRDFAAGKKTDEEKRLARIEQRTYSYNVDQAMISVGSGGLWGKGWGQGQQIALGYLPRGVSHNDFIFSVIAEEKGFLGSLVVITLYAGVLFRGIRIAGQARDRLGQLLAIGVVTMLFTHVFVNIGMNIRLMPVTGIPLPLLSYGGSSVLCSLIAIGILQNVYLRHRE
jgi:rod shape determining protein RodA